jgi:hypothetical protein
VKKLVKMGIEELINRIIIDIYCVSTYEHGGLNTASCFIELDDKLIIDIPWSFSEEVNITELVPHSISIFRKKQERSFLFFKPEKSISFEALIKNKKIKDFIYYVEDLDKGFFELETGGLITETRVTPQGTGLEGLNYYTGIEELVSRFGPNYLRFSDKKDHPLI